MSSKAKKQVAVSATSILITEKKKKKIEQIPCIRYSITFKDLIKVLLSSESKINAIS